MKKLLMMIGAAGCLALEAFANTAATYTAGVTSLAGGKITFEYDSSDNITAMRMSSDYGETLKLTGDTLVFADGAEVTLGNAGTNEIANAISAASLTLSPDGPYTWTKASGLKAKSFETLFENCDIDMIEPVSATPLSYLAQSGDTAYPFFVTRGVDADGTKWMKCELQCYNNGKTSGTGSYLRALYIQLKQVGSNIVGKIIDGGYWAFDMSNLYYGHSMFADPDTSLLSNYTHYTAYCAEDVGTKGFGISSLTVRARGRLTLDVSGDFTVPALAGGDMDVTFKAVDGGAVVNPGDGSGSLKNTMTNTAFIVVGDAENKMVFHANHTESPYWSLPVGSIDVYGEGTVFYDWGRGDNTLTNPRDGTCLITMHTATELCTTNQKHAFARAAQNLVLDGATFTLKNWVYLNSLVMTNGAYVAPAPRGGDLNTYGSAEWRVVGTGMSTLRGNFITPYWTDNSAVLTFYVEDTVEGDGTDLLIDGDIKKGKACIRKTGPGTMQLNGMIHHTGYGPRIAEGTMLLAASGILVDESENPGSATLEGGTLALAAGKSNRAASISVTADSAISFSAGATLTVTTLTLGEDVERLDITAADGEYPITVLNTLDSAARAKIRLNGKRVKQASDGRLVRPGLIISFM